MQVILQGSLRQFPAAELLAFLCSRNQKGTLDLENAGRRTRVLFENDRVVWSESNKISDPIDSLIDAFTWDGGTFTLLDAFAVPQNATPLGLTLDALHEEAKRREGAYRDDTLFRVVENPAQGQVSLSGEEFKILFRAGGGRTLAELAADLGIEKKHLAEQLKKLEGMGLLESGREEPVTAPQSSPMIPVPPPPPPAPAAAPVPDPAAAEHPFKPKTDKITKQEDAELTRIERKTIERRRTEAPKTIARKKTMVGSLTPDDAPDSVFPLLDAECIVGRSPDVAIVIADGSVSSQHARISRTPEGFVIEDLQSRNGTFVNGEKVEKQPRLLADGDLVRFGKVILTFNVAQEEKMSSATEPQIRL